jgi:uncharacterized Rossmann fold enzyme
MLLGRWLPLYHEIVADLGFNEDQDIQAGILLASLLRGRERPDPERVRPLLAGRATVVAKGPHVREQLRRRRHQGPLISAGSATSILLEEGYMPDVVVSDLDGETQAEVTANAQGALCFLHAHGDNTDLLRKWAPKYPGLVVPTMQPAPVQGVFNFGGLTDGDRAVEIARHFGAREIELLGFDFDWLEVDNPHRRKKMEWARRITFEMNPRAVILRKVRE